jgi:hypothetical protein
VVAADPSGARVFHKLTSIEDARAKARALEAYLAAHQLILELLGPAVQHHLLGATVRAGVG